MLKQRSANHLPRRNHLTQELLKHDRPGRNHLTQGAAEQEHHKRDLSVCDHPTQDVAEQDHHKRDLSVSDHLTQDVAEQELPGAAASVRSPRAQIRKVNPDISTTYQKETRFKKVSP
ncbi:MAG: hypothetical protein K5767_06405 [Clostridia bacterium]|nr:hypothetical protein [Clostridia bacterium]